LGSTAVAIAAITPRIAPAGLSCRVSAMLQSYSKWWLASVDPVKHDSAMFNAFAPPIALGGLPERELQ
jgi:hypothetical protein